MPGLWSAKIDEGQISQVLENLILNADHSMPHGSMVTISTENVHHVPGPENSALPLEKGIYVKVSVLDEGPGIPEDQLEYVFRPYHTANESGHGLGLATTFTILKNHQGHVEVWTWHRIQFLPLVHRQDTAACGRARSLAARRNRSRS
jgi:two-component system, cell cycle sensor histidine kinase and response regulator CckA